MRSLDPMFVSGGDVDRTAAALRQAEVSGGPMASAITAAVHARTLGEQVFAQLKNALVVGRLAPGLSLSLRSLCARFGTSVTPVREAVNRLTAISAFDRHGHSAVRVPILCLADRDELMRVRLALERLALQDCAQVRADGVRSLELQELLEALADHVSGSDPVVFATALLALRSRLFNCGADSVLGAMIDRVWCRFGPGFTQSLTSPFVRQRLLVDYTMIVAAIQQGEVAAAEMALDREIQASSGLFLEGWIGPRSYSPSLAPDVWPEAGRAHLSMGGDQ